MIIYHKIQIKLFQICYFSHIKENRKLNHYLHITYYSNTSWITMNCWVISMRSISSLQGYFQVHFSNQLQFDIRRGTTQIPQCMIIYCTISWVWCYNTDKNFILYIFLDQFLAYSNIFRSIVVTSYNLILERVQHKFQIV